MTRIAYLLPGMELHGGNRVPMDQAAELRRRGYKVEIWSPSASPKWHKMPVKYVQADIFSGELPSADICVATFWTTVEPAFNSGAARVFHLCQGFEGIHPENRNQLPLIDAAYSMPTEKLVISPHLADILRERYGISAQFIGTGIDLTLFQPGAENEPTEVMRIGVVGSYGVRPKGVREVLEGLRRARGQGMDFEVWRASAIPCVTDEVSLGLQSRFFTKLTTEEMVTFYRSVDCLIHGSWNEEGFGLPPLEAAACGCAVAATDIDPMKAFAPGSILRFPPGRSDVIPGVVRELMKTETRNHLTESARTELASFDIRAVVDRLEALFVQ